MSNDKSNENLNGTPPNSVAGHALQRQRAHTQIAGLTNEINLSFQKAARKLIACTNELIRAVSTRFPV